MGAVVCDHISLISIFVPPMRTISRTILIVVFNVEVIPDESSADPMINDKPAVAATASNKGAVAPSAAAPTTKPPIAKADAAPTTTTEEKSTVVETQKGCFFTVFSIKS